MITGVQPYDINTSADFLSSCGMMLSMQRYAFARQTLSSMQTSVNKTNKFSDKQKQALINIWESKL